MHGLGAYIYWGLIALPVSLGFVGSLVRRVRKGGYAHWAWALLACVLYALVPALGTAIYSFDDHICVPAGLAPRHGPEELFEAGLWMFSMFWVGIPLPFVVHAWGRMRQPGAESGLQRP